MRSFLTFFLFAFIVSGCSQPLKGKNGKIYKTAVIYNDAIVNQQNKIMKDVLDFVEATKVSLDSADKLLDKYVIELDAIIVDIKGMPPFKGDSVLRDAAVGSFQFYKRIMSNEYKQLIRLRQQDDADTPENETQRNDIVEKITKEEEGFDKTFHAAQIEFARKNKIMLTDNDMQKKIDNLNN